MCRCPTRDCVLVHIRNSSHLMHKCCSWRSIRAAALDVDKLDIVLRQACLWQVFLLNFSILPKSPLAFGIVQYGSFAIVWQMH